jgi:hypothetical protein
MPASIMDVTDDEPHARSADSSKCLMIAQHVLRFASKSPLTTQLRGMLSFLFNGRSDLMILRRSKFRRLIDVRVGVGRASAKRSNNGL